MRVEVGPPRHASVKPVKSVEAAEVLRLPSHHQLKSLLVLLPQSSPKPPCPLLLLSLQLQPKKPAVWIRTRRPFTAACQGVGVRASVFPRC